jgi:NADH:quinone reductase (non-electrogenic)
MSATIPAGGQRRRIVILGGGFAGVYLARRLERRTRRRSDVDIVLVNKENYFVFQPLLPEVISGTIGLTDVVAPLRRLLRRTDVHVRDVEGIDLEARTVTLAPGFHAHPHVLHYDHLVIALGTVTDFRGLRGLPEHAFPFKNLADALRLRNHIIRALEEASIEREDLDLRRRLLTFVVAGGGFSGVEVAAELNDFVRVAVRSYPGIDPAELRVILVHSQDRILPEVSPGLAHFAQRLLTRRGVDIRLGKRIEAATAQSAVLAGGEAVPTMTLVSTVPSVPHPLVDALAVEKTGGRIAVDASCRLSGRTDVWAMGDCARVPAPGGGFSPPTAQHAVRQAEVAADNIVAALDGAPARPLAFAGLGKMGSLGRRSAVAEILGLKISGFLAWFLWRTIYLLKLPGWGRRLKVAASWTLDLLLPPELIQLKTEATTALAEQHYEPGEVVFHEGDAGDRLYIILAGRAEVLVGSRQVAELGAGAYFGEMALVSNARRNATVRCLDAMNVLALPKRDFGLLAAHLPGVRQSVERVIQERAAAAARDGRDGRPQSLLENR